MALAISSAVFMSILTGVTMLGEMRLNFVIVSLIDSRNMGIRKALKFDFKPKTHF